MKYEFKKKRLIAIKEVIIQRGKIHDNSSLSSIQRWFYTLKAIICLFLNKRMNRRTEKDILPVAMLFLYMDLYSCEWTNLAVGVGVFKGWDYSIHNYSSS